VSQYAAFGKGACRHMSNGGGFGPSTGASSRPQVPGDHAGAHGSRVDLGRVLTGLRHLDACTEPARVFTGLAGVCVPALCDECLIQVTEQGRHPYRIRRSGPSAVPDAAPITDEEFTAVIDSRGVIMNGLPTGGATVETTDHAVIARFANPPGGGPDYQGVLVCRWHAGHVPGGADAGLVGVLTDHATALVHRERTAAAIPPVDLAGQVVSALNATQRIAAASGILMALYHLSPIQARQLLTRASEHTHRPVSEIAETVLRTGTLPESQPRATAVTETGTRGDSGTHP
jgi:hypothetical protein